MRTGRVWRPNIKLVLVLGLLMRKGKYNLFTDDNVTFFVIRGEVKNYQNNPGLCFREEHKGISVGPASPQ